ncbi:MAG: hypothetical protein K6G28_04005 [Acholeplasmatales bacterium]|nr:hypothetical protein [Acholeplasmatales bacterium]
MFKKLISLIISVFLTAISTILFTFAWFAQNKQAMGTGINAIANSSNITDGHIKRYLAVYDKKTNTYTKGDILDNDGISVAPYDTLNDYSKVIYEIGAEINKESYTITLNNNDSNVNRYFTLDESTNQYVNYLSNVAVFYKLNTIDGGTTFTKTNESATSLSYVDERANVLTEEILYDNVSAIKGEQVVQYLLFDYNEDNINKLYSANLGTTIDKIYFKEDLEFRIE